jgi:ATP-dependent Clp protease ATP-binding subunit ClpC
MPNKPICDICHIRPATHTIQVSRNGKREIIQVCDVDYQNAIEQRGFFSPFESSFGADPFGFSSDYYDNFENLSSRIGFPIPRHRESVDIDQFFSEHTKELIQKAAQKVIESGRNELDTEHLLYALIDSDVITEILEQFNINPKDLKGYVEDNIPKGRLDKKEKAEVTVSPRVKNVIEKAFEVSREMGHSYIGPEHLLLGLAMEEDGLAYDILKSYGLNANAIRQQTLKVVGRGAKEGRVETKTKTPQLDKYSRDLSRLAKEGKLDPVIGRSDEIETTIEILSRRTKNNPALIGEPGVGKTAIVEGLAQRIENRDVPEVLLNKRVVEFNINSIVAGSKYRGEFEERIKEVIDEIVVHKDELIIFVDELHNIVGAGATGTEGGLDVSNVIKPYLARGELHLIGATTLNEYQKYIEKDMALERRFQPVFISEPTVLQTIEILRGLRDKYEAHHKVKITDEAIVAAAELSNKYISTRFLPDKAIDLVDQAASRVRILYASKPETVKKIEEKVTRLKREEESATSRRQYDQAKRYAEEIQALEKNIEEERANWRRERGVTTGEVKKEHIAQIVSKITGIPVTDLTQEERERLLKMEEKLHQRVIGQNEAVTAVSDAVRRSRAGLTSGKHPIATLMFLGPTGVGKTELARSLAWVIFGDDEALIRLDMSEYRERHSVSRLIGAPPGYVEYEEAGQLTESIRRRPYSVVLLDEIEKAHPDVFNILLQVLDDGRLTDSKGRTVDFTNTIIIATSNLGSDIIYKNLMTKQKKSYEELRGELNILLKNYFRPEFLNRTDEIIVFHALTEEEIKTITKLRLERLKVMARGQGIDLSFDKSAVEHIAKEGFAPEFGARELQRKIKTEIENPLAKEVLSGKIKEGEKIVAFFDPVNHVFNFSHSASP